MVIQIAKEVKEPRKYLTFRYIELRIGRIVLGRVGKKNKGKLKLYKMDNVVGL